MNPNPEVRTRSVPTAGALICMGHEPTRTIYRDHGGSLIVFAPSARRIALCFSPSAVRI